MLAATLDTPETRQNLSPQGIPKAMEVPLHFTEVTGRMLALCSASMQYFSGRPVALRDKTQV
jgi:hypothetical protein